MPHARLPPLREKNDYGQHMTKRTGVLVVEPAPLSVDKVCCCGSEGGAAEKSSAGTTGLAAFFMDGERADGVRTPSDATQAPQHELEGVFDFFSTKLGSCRSHTHKHL